VSQRRTASTKRSFGLLLGRTLIAGSGCHSSQYGFLCIVSKTLRRSSLSCSLALAILSIPWPESASAFGQALSPLVSLTSIDAFREWALRVRISVRTFHGRSIIGNTYPPAGPILTSVHLKFDVMTWVVAFLVMDGILGAPTWIPRPEDTFSD